MHEPNRKHHNLYLAFKQINNLLSYLLLGFKSAMVKNNTHFADTQHPGQLCY